MQARGNEEAVPVSIRMKRSVLDDAHAHVIKMRPRITIGALIEKALEPILYPKKSRKSNA